MKYSPLGSIDFPAIGMGTYKITGPEAVDIITKAILSGYRHIDTAQVYYNEGEIGTAIRKSGVPRNEILITTKVWPSNLTEDKFLPSVKESLQKLGTGHIDLLLIHWPHHEMPVSAYITTLMEARNLGLAREIGVSNFNIGQLKEVIKSQVPIVANQIEFHPWVNQVKLHEFMQEHNINLIAYCPLGKGRLILDKKLESLAATHLKTPAQIILRWLIQKENILAIPKSINIYRLQENLDVFDFELSKIDMEMIDAWRLENIRMVDAQGGAVWD